MRLRPCILTEFGITPTAPVWRTRLTYPNAIVAASSIERTSTTLSGLCGRVLFMQMGPSDWEGPICMT